MIAKPCGTHEEQFFIKHGYREQPLSVDYAGTEYWTEARRARAYAIEQPVYKWAARVARTHRPRRALDFGCGYAVKTDRYIRPECDEVVGIDGSAIIRRCRQEFPKIRFVEDDLEQPSATFADPFDLVIFADVIEHLQAPGAALEFIHRNVHATSSILISTPERDLARGLECNRSTKREHVREWNRAEFQTWATDVAARFGYGVKFLPIGDEDDRAGPPTQMAVFAR